MRNGTYILTGGTGFLGSLLGLRLLQDGCTVFFLGRRSETHSYESRQQMILRDIDPSVSLDRAHFLEVDFARADLGLSEDACHLMKTASIFFHLAADLSFKKSHKHRVRKTNFENLRHVMTLSLALQTKFIFVSTAYVHGNQPAGTHIPEQLFPRPRSFHNPYEESKYDAEYYVKDWAQTHGASYAILRPAIIVDRQGKTSTRYGFSSFLIGIEKLKRRFPRLISGVFSPFLIPFPYSSRARLNLVPADWVVDAMIAIAQKNNVNGRVFNLTNPRPTPIKRIIHYTFEMGAQALFCDFAVPVSVLRLYIWSLYMIGFVIRPLRGITERLWLYLFCMTEELTYEMGHTNELVQSDGVSDPTLTDEDLTMIAVHFIDHYYRKRGQ